MCFAAGVKSKYSLCSGAGMLSMRRLWRSISPESGCSVSGTMLRDKTSMIAHTLCTAPICSLPLHSSKRRGYSPSRPFPGAVTTFI